MMNALLRILLAALAKNDSISIPLNSEAVASIDAGGGGLTVTMRSGHQYQISEADALGLLTASSAGKYFNEYLKGRV